MEGQIAPVLNNLLYATLIALVSLLTYAAKAGIDLAKTYLTQKMGKAGFDRMVEFGDIVVRFIEQSPEFQEWTGPEKLERAMQDMEKFAVDHNFPVDEETIRKIIESTLQVIKGEQPGLGLAVGELQ